MAALVAVTLVVAPYTLIEPINLPKLLTLAFLSIIMVSVIAPESKRLINSKYKHLFIILSLFIIQILIVLFFSGANILGQFYGTFGRNTGALAYLSLVVLLMSSALVSNKEFLTRFARVTLIVGAILIIYGVIQNQGLEPFPFSNLYAPLAPIGTFGNLDFQSAFMGIIAVFSFILSLNTNFKPYGRVLLIIMGFSSIVVIYQTTSKQGYLNLLAGLLVAAILWSFMTKRKSIGISVAFVGSAGGGLVFLGLFNVGPLANYLFNTSVVARGYYWRAALKMMTDHPFFGVGMDGFIDWYRRSRPTDYYENGFTTFSNTAHNVFLDVASSGGVPLLLIYCYIFALVIIAVVKVVKRNDGFDVHFVAMVGAWVAYQAQSLVSINQLGLAIWGWVLSGLIIGYEINTRDEKPERDVSVKNKQPQRKGKVVEQPLSSAALMRVFGGVILGALVAIPPYYVNASFFSALKSGDIEAIKTAAYLKPIDERRLLHVATIMRDSKMDSEAIAVIRDATMDYPNSFDFWQLWTSIPTAAPADIAAAKAQMKRLDPFNPDIK